MVSSELAKDFEHFSAATPSIDVISSHVDATLVCTTPLFEADLTNLSLISDQNELSYPEATAVPTPAVPPNLVAKPFKISDGFSCKNRVIRPRMLAQTPMMARC